MPNGPQWLFDPIVPEAERGRYISDIVAALKTVYDPEIPCDILRARSDLQSRYRRQSPVKIDMTLTAPGCPVASEIARSVETAVGAVQGVLGVGVAVVFDPPWDQGRMSMKRGFRSTYFEVPALEHAIASAAQCNLLVR